MPKCKQGPQNRSNNVFCWPTLLGNSYYLSSFLASPRCSAHLIASRRPSLRLTPSLCGHCHGWVFIARLITSVDLDLHAFNFDTRVDITQIVSGMFLYLSTQYDHLLNLFSYSTVSTACPPTRRTRSRFDWNISGPRA